MALEPERATSQVNTGFWGNTQVQETISFLKTLVVILGIVFLVIRPTLVEPFKIPSGSMIPTLLKTDYIVVNKLSYGLRLPFLANSVVQWSTPSRGDVVVFTRPDDPATSEDEAETNLIKRVVGLSGETIEVRGPKVYINGNLLDEPYARWDQGGRPDGDFGPVVIPEGHILLLGDNRDESKDSRFWNYPFLDARRVKGRALFIYWTFAPGFFSRVFHAIR